MLEAIKNYFNTYENIGEDTVIYADYVPEQPVTYSLIQIPSQSGGTVKSFVGGDKIKEFVFAFMIKQYYSTTNDEDKLNFSNSKFFEDLQLWIEDNNDKGEYPKITGVQRVEVLQTGFLFDVDANGQYASYQMSARVVYYQERK